MAIVTIRRRGGALLHLWNDEAGQGWDVPAGPCEVRVPAWVVPLVPDAEIVDASPAESPAREE